MLGYLPPGKPVNSIILDNGVLCVAVLTFGAVLQSIETYNRNGGWCNVVRGLTSLYDFIARSPYFGAVPGRFAGRIARDQFTLDGVTYQLEGNQGVNAVPRGPQGFGKRRWTLASYDAHHVALELVSPDGEAGYPGTVRLRVRCSLDGEALRIDFHAETDRPSILNLTNRSWFNLADEGSGDVLDHELTIDSNHMIPIDPESIPTGEIRSVRETPFDFRIPQFIGTRIFQADPQIMHALGYDHASILPGGNLRRAARQHEPRTGHTVIVLTTQPFLQLYTGNTVQRDLTGPAGRTYRQSSGVCLEAQCPQHNPSHPAFPSTELR